jgi:hypothetical protein
MSWDIWKTRVCFIWTMNCRIISNIRLTSGQLGGGARSWSYGSWNYNYLCNQCLSPQNLINKSINKIVLISHNNDIVTHQESDYDSDTETHHMSRKHNVIKQKTKTRLIFNISQREIKELHCPVSADESFFTLECSSNQFIKR